MLLRPGFGFASALATFVAGQTGNSGSVSSALGAAGARAGDFAIWINGAPPGTNTWTYLSGSQQGITYRRLTSDDLGATATQTGGSKWGGLVYRDVTAIALRSAAGFTKATAHVGVLGISSSGLVPPVTSPAGTVLRLANQDQASLTAFDIVAPGDPYSGGAWTPGAAATWDIIEMLRT